MKTDRIGKPELAQTEIWRRIADNDKAIVKRMGFFVWCMPNAGQELIEQ